MHRRLPLLVSSPASVVPGDVPILDVSARTRVAAAVGLADTGDGDAAARFALALGQALSALGVTPHVAFTADDRVPVLGAALQAAYTRARLDVSLHAITATAPRLPVPPGPVLLVGGPALTLFAPSLTLLIDAGRPPSRWSPALRGVRDEVDLAIGAARPALARALAAALMARGFLPREEQGVG